LHLQSHFFVKHRATNTGLTWYQLKQEPIIIFSGYQENFLDESAIAPKLLMPKIPKPSPARDQNLSSTNFYLFSICLVFYKSK